MPSESEVRDARQWTANRLLKDHEKRGKKISRSEAERTINESCDRQARKDRGQ